MASMQSSAALKAVADDEIVELESVTILGQYGDTLRDFVESLQGG